MPQLRGIGIECSHRCATDVIPGNPCQKGGVSSGEDLHELLDLGHVAVAKARGQVRLVLLEEIAKLPELFDGPNLPDGGDHKRDDSRCAAAAIVNRQGDRAAGSRRNARRTPRQMASISRLLRSALCAFVAAAVPAGCGGSQAVRVVPAALAPPAHVPLEQAPDESKGTLIYAVGDESSFVFTYPRGKLVHEIATTGYSVCSDRVGNVFVTQVRSVAKYAHGGSEPVETYKLDAGSVYSCSVSPKTQDLALVVFCIRGCGDEVIVLRNHGPRLRYHVAGLSSLLYCAYNDKGDLFVDGYNGTRFGLAELPKGAHKFIGISLKRQIKYAAQIQWDGENLAIETREFPTIYRVAISGSTAQVVGRTRFEGIGYRATQSWIENGTIAVPSASYNKRPMEIFLYNYPAGGQPTKIISGFIRGGNHAMIDGVTFSTRPFNVSP